MRICAILLIAFCSCTAGGSNQSKAEVDSFNYEIDSTQIIAQLNKNKEDSISRLANEKEIERLSKNFIIKKDEFRGMTFYKHRNWGSSWLNRKALYAYFNSSGDLFLVSNYFADDWIFHTQATILIDEETMTTAEVPTYSEQNVTENDGGSVWENVTYTGEETIIKKIAGNTDKKIKVRLHGRQYYSDFTLTERDKKAFKDVAQLFALIK